MIFGQKIPCYVIVFEQTEIIKKTLEFLSKYTDKIDLIIIENPSDNSVEIKKLIDSFGEQGHIKRHYIFDENITGNAYSVVIEHEANFIKRHKYVILTDGDITSENTDWLEEQKRIIKHKEVFACGITLDTANLPLKTFPDAKGWIPADMNETSNYYEAYTGVHLLLIRSKDLLGFMNWKKQQNLSFVDGNIHAYCYEQAHKKWTRTKNAKAYHLTWDLYHDRNHPYTKFKLAKTFKTMWYHQKTADFTVREFK